MNTRNVDPNDLYEIADGNDCATAPSTSTTGDVTLTPYDANNNVGQVWTVGADVNNTTLSLDNSAGSTVYLVGRATEGDQVKVTGTASSASNWVINTDGSAQLTGDAIWYLAKSGSNVVMSATKKTWTWNQQTIKSTGTA